MEVAVASMEAVQASAEYSIYCRSPMDADFLPSYGSNVTCMAASIYFLHGSRLCPCRSKFYFFRGSFHRLPQKKNSKIMSNKTELRPPFPKLNCLYYFARTLQDPASKKVFHLTGDDGDGNGEAGGVVAERIKALRLALNAKP